MRERARALLVMIPNESSDSRAGLHGGRHEDTIHRRLRLLRPLGRAPRCSTNSTRCATRRPDTPLAAPAPQQVDSLLSRLRILQEKIRNTEHLVSLDLGQKRNSLVAVGLVIDVGLIGLAAGRPPCE